MNDNEFIQYLRDENARLYMELQKTGPGKPRECTCPHCTVGVPGCSCPKCEQRREEA